MQVGLIGLGRMGAGIAHRLTTAGLEVVGVDRDPTRAEAVAGQGVQVVESLEDVVQTLARPRIIWLMVPHGEPVEQGIRALASHCSAGDLVVDGSNSHFRDSMRRAAYLAERGCELLDVGVSGGVHGEEVGYCLMVGGTATGFARLEPVLRVLAAPEGYAHVGPSGAGHYAKMLHNGIEYGLMQAYGEGLALLSRAPFDYRVDQVAALWTHGSIIRSWLLELTAQTLAQDPTLQGVAPFVDDTGSGRWTLQVALEQGVSTPVLAAAVLARLRSRDPVAFADRVVAALRREFGGHAVRSPDEGADG